jgi:hypothetical protein
LNQKLLKTVTITLAALTLLFGVAFAAVLTSHSVSNTITITETGQGNFDIFSDSSLTQQFTSLSWDSMGNGQWQEKTLYLLNNGGSTIYVSWATPDIATGFNVLVSNPISQPFPTETPVSSPFPSATPSPSSGLWYPSSMYKLALQPNQPVQVQVWLTTLSVTSGSYSWTLTFTGEDS